MRSTSSRIAGPRTRTDRHLRPPYGSRGRNAEPRLRPASSTTDPNRSTDSLSFGDLTQGPVQACRAHPTARFMYPWFSWGYHNLSNRLELLVQQELYPEALVMSVQAYEQGLSRIIWSDMVEKRISLPEKPKQSVKWACSEWRDGQLRQLSPSKFKAQWRKTGSDPKGHPLNTVVDDVVGKGAWAILMAKAPVRVPKSVNGAPVSCGLLRMRNHLVHGLWAPRSAERRPRDPRGLGRRLRQEAVSSRQRHEQLRGPGPVSQSLRVPAAHRRREVHHEQADPEEVSHVSMPPLNGSKAANPAASLGLRCVGSRASSVPGVRPPAAR